MIVYHLNMCGDLVSIIVPVYNTEKYVQRCIDSICNQTYQNWELLLINDGSKDSSLEILKKNAEKDSRIRVFTQENKGNAAARNVGLINAKGAYITFVDSDDSYEDSYLDLHLQTRKNKCELSISNFNYISELNKFDTYSASLTDHYYTTTKDLAKEYLNKGLLLYSNTNKLYDAEIIKDNSILFFGGSFGEDRLFNYKYLMAKPKGITTIAKPLTNYFTDHDGSMTNKVISDFLPLLLSLHEKKLKWIKTEIEDETLVLNFQRKDFLSELNNWVKYLIAHKDIMTESQLKNEFNHLLKCRINLKLIGQNRKYKSIGKACPSKILFSRLLHSYSMFEKYIRSMGRENGK